ncbi:MULTISPECIES: hypothetical protein [unclassified Halomonas]|uniref:O-antigen ligase family protein n=1 Tax=unclassified Halomonas TaxID=2609666 RepID=UPI0028864C06|nr:MULTISPECIES: hypothetical protein [unclassified Halomonas]MDT0499405.1 hypothetical protein [Halomonas sp. PAR7]MDT0510778.1 hypothetical protein [Halomonas sp. LES1]MDT0591693.1 hypothetical protein [Halomonas sp. PAR8]
MRSIHIVAILLFPVIFTIPIENVLVIDGLGTINRVIGIAAAPAVFFLVLAGGRVNQAVYMLGLAMLMFIVYGGLSIAWAPSSHEAYISWFSMVQVMVMALMISLAGICYGLKVICVPYLLGAVYGAITVISYAASSDSIRRIVVDNFNPNWMSFLFVMSGVCLFVLLDSASFKARVFYLFSWCIIGLSIFLLGSRGGMGFYVLMSLSIMLKLTFIYKLILVVPVALTMLVYQLVVQADIEYLLMRYMMAGDLISSGDFSGRGNIWQHGMDGLGNPLFGAGIGSFHEIIGLAPHNAFLSVVFGLGIVGLFMYLGLWLGLIYLFLCLDRGRIAAMVMGGALLIPMNLANWEFHKGLWFAFAVTFAYAILRLIDQSHKRVSLLDDDGYTRQDVLRPLTTVTS